MAGILLDSCVWGGCVEPLRLFGHDVDWCGCWDKDPGDMVILNEAFVKQRILFTMDKDFGELAILKGLPHQGIVRLQGFRVTELAGIIHRILQGYEDILIEGALIVVNPKRVRIRRSRT
jgi:predicted nuclease of predicted toxin-antitoxin system